MKEGETESEANEAQNSVYSCRNRREKAESGQAKKGEVRTEERKSTSNANYNLKCSRFTLK